MRTAIVGRALAGLLACTALVGASAPDRDFARQEGLNLNSFVRRGPVAAHIVLRSGTSPRLIVAFPAGNSGVGLWFDTVGTAADWTMPTPAQPVTLADARGRPLHGVTFVAEIHVPRLQAKQAVLSSIRVLRDYQALGTAPAEVLTSPTSMNGTLTWARDRLDGAPGYRLGIKAIRGSLAGAAIVADKDGVIALQITALTGETPLTPVAGSLLLNATAAADPTARRALEFLSYREKFLAGSWRFDTYFGRDTLMSVRLLMPALQPDAIETGLASVLQRLSPAGQVAHEEDIGEFAILDHRKTDRTSSAAPVYNYNMIDSDFMLAPVARAWMIDDPRGRTRAAAFLARSVDGERMGDLMLRNIRFVAGRARAFARAPIATNLIPLKSGMDAGEWRDSNDGLGGGRFAYDVNAVFVPAALDAAAKFYRSGLLAPYASAEDRALFTALPAMAETWRERAPGLFAVTVPAVEARAAMTAYAGKLGVPAALISGPVRFHAIALDGQGHPVPVQNSDEGFAMLFGKLSPEAAGGAADVIDRPFPSGLMTGAGMLVANPVFASPALQARFGPGAYHGVVVWSWQQALAAAGLARQLARSDLPAATRVRLRDTQTCLWRAIDATRSVQNSELWSWKYAAGGYRIAPFGASGADVDESNAAQLWSTVYLALAHPAPSPNAHCLVP